MPEPEEVVNADVKIEQVKVEIVEDLAEEELTNGGLKIKQGDKKHVVRTKVWNYLRDKQICTFVKPHRRISNFVGSEEAVKLVTSLDVFKNATNIKVDPDQPLNQIRMKILEEGKNLFVRLPGLRNEFMSQIIKPQDCSKATLRGCCSQRGVHEHGQTVDIDSGIRIDLIIVGCVAVSPKGWRIGKGMGLCDLEHAILQSGGSVDGSVPIIAVVHDCQVLDLPDDLFASHDVPVDYIVTSTQIISCAKYSQEKGMQCLVKPSGLIWSLLTEGTLKRIPVLNRLRYREWKAGKNVAIAGMSTDSVTELTDVILPKDTTDDRKNVHRWSKRRKSKPQVSSSVEPVSDEKESTNSLSKAGNNRRRQRMRGSKQKKNVEDKKSETSIEINRKEKHGVAEHGDGTDVRESDSNSSQQQGQTSTDGTAGQNVGKGDVAVVKSKSEKSLSTKRRNIYAGSVYVGRLPRAVRVSEFKAEVRERKVNPMRILWRGGAGFAFLNFKTHEDAETALEALNGLQVNDKSVMVEMARSASAGAVNRRSGYRRPRHNGGGPRRSSTGSNLLVTDEQTSVADQQSEGVAVALNGN